MQNEIIIKTGLALLFLGCLADMSYGYYQLVRFLGMIGFFWLAFKENERGNKGLLVFWLSSALLINPIFKISLGRELWNVIDVIWAIILLLSAITGFAAEKDEQTSKT